MTRRPGSVVLKIPAVIFLSPRVFHTSVAVVARSNPNAADRIDRSINQLISRRRDSCSTSRETKERERERGKQSRVIRLADSTRFRPDAPRTNSFAAATFRSRHRDPRQELHRAIRHRGLFRERREAAGYHRRRWIHKRERSERDSHSTRSVNLSRCA